MWRMKLQWQKRWKSKVVPMAFAEEQQKCRILMAPATWSWLQDNTAVIIGRRDKMSRMCRQNCQKHPKRWHPASHSITKRNSLYLLSFVFYFNYK